MNEVTPPPALTTQQLTGRALRFLRKREGLTQAEAAEAYGCETTSWRRYEAGERDLSIEQLEGLARALNSTLDEILAVRADLAQGRTPQLGVAETQRPFEIGSPSRRQAVFNLRAGDVVVSYPGDMTPDDKAKFAEYLAIFMKGLAD